jgi:hypothetical protein
MKPRTLENIVLAIPALLFIGVVFFVAMSPRIPSYKCGAVMDSAFKPYWEHDPYFYAASWGEPVKDTLSYNFYKIKNKN